MPKSNKRFLVGFFAFAVTIIPQPLLAWGKTGHRVIGEIADHNLSPEARGSVIAILGKEGLAEASNWPDFMRSDPDPYWQRTANPWHYVTVPTGQTYKAAPPEGDALTALRDFTRTVRDRNAPLADRQRALRFIVHIVGDLHQPLHVGNGSDRGGNDVKVTWFGKTTSLHAVWDSDLIDDQQLSYTELSTWLIQKATPEQYVGWTTADPIGWLNNSAALRDKIYRADPALSWRYIYDTKAQLDEQLLRGGLDLAAYLNWVFQPAAKK